jgi:hypothetical protein
LIIDVLQDVVRTASPDHFLCREPADYFRAAIPKADSAVPIHEVNAVGDAIQDLL